MSEITDSVLWLPETAKDGVVPGSGHEQPKKPSPSSPARLPLRLFEVQVAMIERQIRRRSVPNSVRSARKRKRQRQRRARRHNR